MPPTSQAVREAVMRHARETPLLPAPGLAEMLGSPVFVKAECLQATGSFKVRGAAARLESLTPDERARGVVACSSGNHGRAMSYVAGRAGIPATVFVPEWVDPVKLEGIVAGGAEAVLYGETFDESEAAAITAAKESGSVYVSAYDDPWVIAGQGTIGLEIREQLGPRPLGAVMVPLSGGGLIGGIARALSHSGSRVEERTTGDAHVVGVSAARAAVMMESVRAGRPVELPEEETLANALAGGIGLDNQHSFGLVRDTVDTYVAVSEEEIAFAMRYAAERLRLVLEGGGAVALAAALSGTWRPPSPDCVTVIVGSGGNVAPAVLARLLGVGTP